MTKELELSILSKELIKPSSPTPSHLQFHQLSFLDQITVPVFMPLVFFYSKEATISNLEQLGLVKQSLSHALTRFYPLAGRVKDNAYIDCNDEGVHLVEAQANCDLEELLRNPNPSNNNKLLPFELDDVRDLLAVLQVTFFTCGGMAIGFGLSHKVADALSFIMFINTWADIARDGGDVAVDSYLPRFDSCTLFPPKDISGFQLRTGIVKDKVVSKRFVFDASAVSAIRAKYTDETLLEDRPTRIEALSAFIWSRFIASIKPKTDTSNKIYTVIFAVNMRPRMDPPLPNTYFGNIIGPAIAMPNMNDSHTDGRHGIVKLIKDAVRKANFDDYVEMQLQQKDAFIKERAKQVVKGDVVPLSFTSLCRFPIYEADFGWGKPVWVGAAKLLFNSQVTFIDAKEGGGIEAYFNFKEEDMARFEEDMEFLAHLSPITSVSVIPHV